MSKTITYDMLTDLGHNIQTIFEILHPNGLSIEELLKKADKYAFYRGIYNHVKEVIK